MRAIRYHDEARLELVHEVGYYTAVNARLGERFDKATIPSELLFRANRVIE